jgi:hypothetical protein
MVLSIPYPPIADLITKLNTLYPRHGLEQYISIFDEKDFHNIDEIARMGKTGLEGPEFWMSAGNAVFLVDAVEKEMKKVDCLNGKAKRPCLSE